MLKATKQNGLSSIVAQGELDRFDCPRLKREFRRANGDVDLDLAMVGFIDSSCTMLISQEAEKVRQDGRRFRFKASPAVMKMLEMLAAAGVDSARRLMFDLKIMRVNVA